jgi:hypothetical protein
VYVLWARNPRAGDRWLPIVKLRGQAAADELIIRQDRIRRSKYECRFKLLPEGETPDP